MNKNAKTILGIVILVVFIGAAYFAYNILSDKYKPDDGTAQNDNDKIAATDFSVIDMKGNEVKLSDFKGKPMVVNFWASWCDPCKSELADFNAEYTKAKDNVAFMMVNMTDGERETVDTCRQFIEESGYSFPVYLDTAGDAAKAYTITSIPMTLFIDKDGYVVRSYMGTIDAETLANGISTVNK